MHLPIIAWLARLIARTAPFWLLGSAVPAAPAPDASSAEPLTAAYRRMGDELARSPFGRPITLESSETASGLQGDVHAVVEQPLKALAAALRTPAQWCEMLTLHINNRRCRVQQGEGGATLVLSVVRRYDKPVQEAFELPFSYRVESAGEDRLVVQMTAATGPFGTHNYRVRLEAMSLGEGRSFVHFGYGYDHNLMIKMATQAYLATFGHHKVGFTVTGRDAQGQPQYIRGLRGLMERNAMRYFLTLEAYTAALAADPAQRRDRSQRLWFAGTEQFPQQLKEVELDTYLAAKRQDRERDGGR